MYKAYAKVGSLFAHGALFLTLGIVMIMTRDYFVETLTWVAGVVFLLMGVLDCIRLLLKNNTKIERNKLISTAVANLALAAVILLFEKLVHGLFPFLIGIMFVFYAVVDFLTFTTFYKNKVKGLVRTFAGFLIKFAIGVSLCFHPLYYIGVTTVYIGIICIAYSVVYFRDAIAKLIPQNKKDKMKRKIRLSLPIFLVAFIPRNTLQYINKHFEIEEDIEPKTAEKANGNLPRPQPDMRVYIHVTKEGYGTIGHVDIGFEGKVYAYGNYDRSSYKLFDSMGDGVLSISSEKKYIPFCMEYSKKTIFEFGLLLNETQKEEMRHALQELQDQVYRWLSPLEEYLKEDDKNKVTDIKTAEFTDYASRLYKYVDGTLYKFKSGRFKSFFVMSTNCVLLADSIIGHLGTQLVDLNGIISPGAYYDYFNRQYLTGNTFVVSKKVHAYDPLAENTLEVNQENE